MFVEGTARSDVVSVSGVVIEQPSRDRVIFVDGTARSDERTRRDWQAFAQTPVCVLSLSIFRSSLDDDCPQIFQLSQVNWMHQL